MEIEHESGVAAARLRLGAGFATEPLPCSLRRGTLDTSGRHAFCRASGEATRGHDEVRDEVCDLARLADASIR